MARLLPKKDAVIIGLGWTGAILAQQLTEAGLDVVAIERGPWRDTATDFNIGYMQDELRYAIRKDLFLNPVLEAVIASPEQHRSGHVAVLCHSLLSRIAPDERGPVIAYLNRMIQSDLN